MNLGTLKFLSKYFFFKEKIDILKKDSENKYAIKNEDWESGACRIHGVSYSSRVLFFYGDEMLECNFALITLMRNKYHSY